MHAAFTWMRANEPVYRDARNGLWGITRHADLRDVERRSTVFASGQGYRAIWNPDEINMIAQDDPRHRQQRLLVQSLQGSGQHQWRLRRQRRRHERPHRFPGGAGDLVVAGGLASHGTLWEEP